MWICDKCETYNNDDDMCCCICNAERGNQVRQESIRSGAIVFAEYIHGHADKHDAIFTKLSTTIPASSAKDASEKVLKEALELPVTEKETLKAKPKPPLKVYGPAKKSSTETFEYYKAAEPKRFRLYYYLRRILRYSLIAANIIAFCQILYCICRIEGLI